jgi:repressor LexA
MNLITRQQSKVLAFIEHEITHNGFAPSYQEIAAHLGINSVSTVHKHVANLTARGLISRGANSKRQYEIHQAPETGKFTVPLLGIIAAGAPIENFAEPEILDLPARLKSSGGGLYALRVRGDSMIDEGIHDGDTVVVEARREARNGEIVVALIGGHEATLKKFRRLEGSRGREVELIPANPALQPKSYPAARVSIQGVLRAVIRLYD